MNANNGAWTALKRVGEPVGDPGAPAAGAGGPSPAMFLHCALFLARNRLLGAEAFRAVSFEGQESVSEPFEYQLELHANTRQKAIDALKFEDLIGRAVSVGIACPEPDADHDAAKDEMLDLFRQAIGGAPADPRLALFNGIVTSFSMEIPGVYRLSMKPALWRLSLTNAYAIHKQMNIRDAIGALLDRHRIAYSTQAIGGADNPAVARVQDWLQAGETDLEFLRRLMGKAHLYYYFVHSGNGHQLVFANLPETPYPPVLAGGKPLRYTYTGADELGMAQPDLISQYSYQRSLSSSAVRSVLTRQEAAWEEDAVAHFQSYQANSASELGELPFNRYKIYQYGCSGDEARQFTKATSAAMESGAVQFSGSSFCPHFRVGHQFSVTAEVMADSHPMPVRPALEGQAFVLTQVRHQASADGAYHNEFQSTEAGGFIAAFSVQETQQGMILAQVVAKSGDPAAQDWRYYRADYFDPETNTLIDHDAQPPKLKAMGVYVRFSTAAPDSAPLWVKLAPHMQTVPEIGVTVLVSRAQDESELPEIQSIIQANGGMTIMPSTWAANTHVGSNYSTSYGDGKSIRFGKNSQADLAHAVGIVTPAYGSGKYRDAGYSQGASYNFSASESNAAASPDAGELWGPYGGATDLLGASESFGSSYNRLHAQVSSSYSKIGTSYSKSQTDLSVNDSSTGAHRNTAMTGTSDSSSMTGMHTSSDVTGSSTTTQLVGVSSSTQVTGMSTGSSMVGVSNQLSLNGVSNAINLTGSAFNSSVTGMSTTVGATGVRSSVEAVGVSTSATLTGASSNASLTGASSEDSVTGATTRNVVVGVASGMTVHGMNSETSVDLNKEMIAMNTTEMSVTLSNGVTVTAASGRVSSEVVGPDISIPAIKIIM
jgi:uncharacterized protein involved in type VI secretion and phage assembly